ncbi:MAG: aconitate hydratase AcnA [Aggregatilineales bacterium]
MCADTVRDPFGARTAFDPGDGSTAYYYRLQTLEDSGIAPVSRLPFSIRILLESALREVNGYDVTEADVNKLAHWDAKHVADEEVPFKPARVLLQDFTGVPCVVDLAAMRSAMKRYGGDPKKIQPQIPVDLVIDHSVQVDLYSAANAVQFNLDMEFGRNRERYEFLRWGQQAFENLRVVPPGVGICHQVNLEYLAKGVLARERDGARVAFPDSLVGTDSHTTMINGLGVLGWGVGGIEAEAVMLGQPIYLVMPEVIGVKLSGRLRDGATATDLALTVTQMLRARGVVDKFVEFFGSGLSNVLLPDRATIANMAPEYGATMGFFPVDDETLRYLRGTGRTDAEVALVERYYKAQGLFRTDETPDAIYTDVIALDLGTIEPSLAGPKRPEDRIRLSDMKQAFQAALRAPIKKQGFELTEDKIARNAEVKLDNGEQTPITHGAVVIAAITSCTNTSNPSVMLAAGLLAKKAVERGLTVPPYVKTSLAPGSRVVTEYLKTSGLLEPLEKLGFGVVGYGCTTCIGNSGPIPDNVTDAVKDGDLVVSAVLSGNRNFEARINPIVRANYLASPPMVVAYALAGTTDIDLNNTPLGCDRDGHDVYLRDLWPTQQEISAELQHAVVPETFRRLYKDLNSFNPLWNEIPVSGNTDFYEWRADSTYIHEPPFFETLDKTPGVQSIMGARVLGMFGDSITTDHISPAGNIAVDSPAGRYLIAHGVQKRDFNTYGTRRGDDLIMLRGTFANIRIKNQIVPGVEGGVTKYLPTGEVMAIFDAAEKYKVDHTPLIVIAGKAYGMGSSRDWAAKGTILLGVRAVIAESYERIHRSNLVGMGVLPLQFKPGESAQSLGLTGEEVFDIPLTENLRPREVVTVRATRPDSSTFTFETIVRIDTPVEVDYYRNGGILQTVMRNMLAKNRNNGKA